MLECLKYLREDRRLDETGQMNRLHSHSRKSRCLCVAFPAFRSCLHGSWIRSAFVLVAALALSGCDFVQRLAAEPEARINEAFPLSPELRGALSALSSMNADAERDRAAFDEELSAKLKLRALTCGKGIKPGAFEGPTELRARIGEPTCFNLQDSALAKWVGMRRTMLLLAKPPLRPIPKSAPAFVVAPEPLSTAEAASQAGVVLLQTLNQFQIVDLGTGKPVLSESKSSNTTMGRLSPNGRVFLTFSGDLVRARDAETGATLLELAAGASRIALWVDQRTILLGRGGQSPGKPVFLDLSTGAEVPVPGTQDSILAAVPVPTVAPAAPRVAIFGYRTVQLIELSRTGNALEPKLIDEVSGENRAIGGGAHGLTSDGQLAFTTQKDLLLFNLNPLKIEIVPFDSLHLTEAFPLPDPDTILLRAQASVPTAQGPRRYVYSISQRTLAELEPGKLPSEQLVYLRPVNKLAAIAGPKLVLLETALPTKPAVPLSTIMSALAAEANERKLAEFEQKLRAVDTGAGSSVEVVRGPIFDLARNSVVEAVGVYEGAGAGGGFGQPRRTGMVDVRVRPSSRPIVLVLSAYEPVRWNIITESGARIAAVLVSSHHPSTVVGAGNARLLQIGQNYAYQRGSAQFAKLAEDVTKLTGQSISVFQGRYQGVSFTVGGG